MNYTLSSGAIVNYITSSSKNNAQYKADCMNRPNPKQNTIKKKPLEEDDIEVVNTIVSCLDVISRQRLKTCVKSSWCSHIECFDLESFRQVNRIAEGFYEREKAPFVSRFEAIPVVDSVAVATENIILEQPKQPVKRTTRAKKNIQEKNASKNKLIVKMTKTKKDSPILFQIRQRTDCNITKAHVKMTNKRKVNGWLAKCPLCGVKFCPTEILHDDFMTLIMKLVPKDVQNIDISEDFIVRKVKEETPYQNQEVVSIDDDDDNDSDDVAIGKRNDTFGINGDDMESDSFDENEIGILDEDDPFAGTENDPVVID